MSDRPSDDGGSAPSDAASRLAALLADVVDDPAPPTSSPRTPDPEATRPIPGLPPVPDAASAREREREEREEEVLAEARA